jgi:hypothetical protein
MITVWNRLRLSSFFTPLLKAVFTTHVPSVFWKLRRLPWCLDR